MAPVTTPDQYKQFLEKYAMICSPNIIESAASELGDLDTDVVLTKTKSNTVKNINNPNITVTVVNDSWDKYYELLVSLFAIKNQYDKDSTEAKAITELMETVATKTNELAKSNPQGHKAVTTGTLDNYHGTLTNAFDKCATSLGIDKEVISTKPNYTGAKAFFITLFADVCRLASLDKKAGKLDQMVTPDIKTQFAKLKETAIITFDSLEESQEEPTEMQEKPSLAGITP